MYKTICIDYYGEELEIHLELDGAKYNIVSIWKDDYEEDITEDFDSLEMTEINMKIEDKLGEEGI